MPSPELIRLAVREWSEVLSGVDGLQAKQGLDGWTEDWPPSAHEFRRCCLGHEGKIHGSAAYSNFEALPRPVCDKAVGSSFLAGMAKGLA